MKKTLYTCVFFSCALGLTTVPLAAQETENSFFTGGFGAGFSTPAYSAGTALDTGWNVQAQAGINLFDAHLSLLAEGVYNHFGINSSTLAADGFPGGTTQIWGFTADPVIRFNPQGRVDFYVTGGPGIFHRHVDFTQPSLATFTGFDPFFGVFYPVAVPVNQVLLSYDTTKFGWNAGAGFNFHVGTGHSKFFAEARYYQMNTAEHTSWIPVTFGFRW